MGKEASDSRTRSPRRIWQVAALLAILLVALPAGGALAQSDGPVPMGIIVQPEPHDLQVRIETNASRYDRGDLVEVEFWVNRDAYVYIYNLDASGKVSLIFPNRYDKENLVQAGTHKLPGRGYSLVVRGPDGLEYLQIIATAAPIGFYDSGALDREGFPNLGAPGSVESKVRAQLEIVPGRQWAVDWTSYRVGRPVSPPPPPPPSWDRRGWLRVESTPSNGYVYVDGTYEGQTPLSLRLDEGSYRVEVRRDGYETESERVRVRAGEETRVHLVLDREDRWEPPSPPAPPPPPPSMPPTSTPSQPPTPPPSEPITREYTPYFRVGFDLGLGPDPDEPGREVFSFGGDFGGPFFGLGFSLRNTGERLWKYVEVESLDKVSETPVTVEEGPESEIYGRFTILRSGDFVLRTGVGLAWQKWATVDSEDYQLYKQGHLVIEMPTGNGYVETDIYPTALIGAGVEHGFGYFWAGYHIRRGVVVGAGFRF